MTKHPLHLAVANALAETIEQHFPGQYKLLRDPACDENCDGKQHLPLFVGPKKGRETRMCCVDLLILCAGEIRAIIEIEESGFLPTKICGKFLQAALANYFIHDSQPEGPLPYADKTSFIQILDSSKFPASGSRKGGQVQLIEREIQSLLPLRRIMDYHLLLVAGKDDSNGLDTLRKLLDRFIPDTSLDELRGITAGVRTFDYREKKDHCL
ncbi:MAG: hypothetical protein ACL93V_09565 [Candidatus Electrothrix sp. YB6]